MHVHFIAREPPKLTVLGPAWKQIPNQTTTLELLLAPMSPTPADSQGSKPLPKWLQVRMAASALLRGRRGTGNVTMLPFNKVVKSNVQPNEIAALEYVAANTTIPVPKGMPPSASPLDWGDD